MKQPHFIGKITAKIRPGFWLYFAIYALVLVIAAMCFLIYTENSLTKYEASQAERVVVRYAQSIKHDALSGKLSEGLSVPALYKQFHLEDQFLADYCRQFSKDTKMSVQRKPGSYDTAQPIYNIYADEIQVGEMQLNAVDSRTIFAILNITDWEIHSFEPLVARYPANNISVTVLSSHQVSVNGEVLDASYVKESDFEAAEFTSFKEFLQNPIKLTAYQVPAALAQFGVNVTTADGGTVPCTPDEDGNIFVDYMDCGTQVPKDLSEQAVLIAKTWDDFLTNDTTFSAVRKYLIPNSALEEQAEIYNGRDIGYISGHKKENNTYSEIVVNDYARYTEDCFSCHIQFTKTMYLNRDHSPVTTDIDSIFYFVLYDGTQDGEDNPTWKMVAMAGVV